MIVIVLWLFTGAYSQQIGVFPHSDAGIAACATVAVGVAEGFKSDAAGLMPFPPYRLACVPTALIGPPTARRAPTSTPFRPNL